MWAWYWKNMSKIFISKVDKFDTGLIIMIQKNRRVRTSSQNLIRFAITCHRGNIWVLQLNVANSEKSIIGYYAARNSTFYVECYVSSMSRTWVLYTLHETNVQFQPLAAYHIFHNTEYIKSPFYLCKRVSMKGKALGKKKFRKFFGKKC